MVQKRSPGLPIPEDWNGQDWCQFSICWPDSLQWRAILAGFITTPMLGRTWDGETGTITDAQAIGQQIFENNLDWRYSLVASCDQGVELSAAIRYLADKMASIGCCNAPGTIGGPGTGGSGTGPETPGETVVENEPPTGWDTWGEYQSDHCNYASYLLDQIEQNLTQMSVLNFTLGIVADIIVALISVITLPIAGSQLFQLAVWLVEIGSNFSYMLTAFSNARDDMLCDLYLALDPAVGRQDALDRFNTAIDALSLGAALTVALKNAFANILTQDAVNKLYVVDETRTYTEVDCSSCGETTAGAVQADVGNIIGTGEDAIGHYTDMESVLYSGKYAAYIKIDPYPDGTPLYFMTNWIDAQPEATGGWFVQGVDDDGNLFGPAYQPSFPDYLGRIKGVGVDISDTYFKVRFYHQEEEPTDWPPA